MYEGPYGNLSTSWRREHEYIGMTLNFFAWNQLKINMEKYNKQVLNIFLDVVRTLAAKPALNRLFEVQHKDIWKRQLKKQARLFQCLMVWLLFLATRVRRDIITTVAFLTTCVLFPDEDNWENLCCIMWYLHWYPNIPLTLEPDGINFARNWWEDASFAVHLYFKSHNSAIMSLGHGAMTDIVRKQKINTKNSIEAELVGVDYVMPQMILSISSSLCKYMHHTSSGQ